MIESILYVMLGRFIVDLLRWGRRRYKIWKINRWVKDQLWHMEMDGKDTTEIRNSINQAYGTKL